MVQALRFRDVCEFDGYRLLDLKLRRDSKKNGGARVSGILADLAALLAKAQVCYERGNRAEISVVANEIVHLSADVGLPSLAAVASDVAVLAPQGDATALSAVMARLGRVGELALIETKMLCDCLN